MSRTRYHAGGLITGAPAQNKAEEWDDATSTYSRWDEGGALAETRPYTAAEQVSATLAAATAAQVSTGDTLRQQAAAAFANLRTIRDAAPVNVTSIAQAQTVCRQLQTAIQTEAAVIIQMGRLILNQMDGTS